MIHSINYITVESCVEQAIIFQKSQKMADYNIQDTPEDDSTSAMRSNYIVPKIQAPAVNDQQCGMSIPQMAQSYVQVSYPQHGPLPQYIQYNPQPVLIPVQPSQVQQQQQANVQAPTPNLDQPLIQNEGPTTLRHDLINRAGTHEQKDFHSRALGQLAFINLFAIVAMAITSSDPKQYTGITFNIFENKFTPVFYLSIVGFILATLISLINLKKSLDKLQKYFIITLWSFSYIMIFQGVFSSSHKLWYWNYNTKYYINRENYGDEIVYSLILLVVQILSILTALHTQKEITYQKFSFYIIPPVAISQLVIYKLSDLDGDDFYWISYFSSLLISFYFIFLIKKINKSGLLKRKTSEATLAPIFWFVNMLFPFYQNEQ